MYFNFIFKIKKHFDDEGSFWKVSRNKKVNKIKNNIIYYEQTKAGLNPMYVGAYKMFTKK